LRHRRHNDAVARAKATAESGVWSGLPDYDRAKVLWRVADLIEENADVLAELESLNAGMPPAQAQIITKVGAEWFRYYAGWCTKIDGIARDVNTGGLTGVDSHLHTYTLREPYGVVGLIFPWNGPVFNFCAKLAPSLAAGCSSVVKPAEEIPLSALVLERILAEAGVPEGVVNLVNGYGHTAGAGHHCASRRRKGRLHRVDRGRPRHRARRGGQQPQQGHSGTRRQVPGGDLR
jgi:phenylacetaldehyde dehydrogenase